MTITPEDLDRKAVDFSDVATGGSCPVHPGEILRDEFLKPLGLSVYRIERSRFLASPVQRAGRRNVARRGTEAPTMRESSRQTATPPRYGRRASPRPHNRFQTSDAILTRQLDSRSINERLEGDARRNSCDLALVHTHTSGTQIDCAT